MRFLLAPALLAAACGPALAAAPSPFRATLDAAGGCGAHRALAEERRGRLGTVSATAVPKGDADLFGKPAGRWTDAEIRDALAAYADCEIRSGPAGTARSERLARELRGLDAALRRAIVAGHAQAPLDAGEERAPHGSGRGCPRRRRPAAAGPRLHPGRHPGPAQRRQRAERPPDRWNCR